MPQLHFETVRTAVGAVLGRSRERGASLVEYALLLALIAVVCLTAINYFGSSVGGSLGDSGSQFSTYSN